MESAIQLNDLKHHCLCTTVFPQRQPRCNVPDALKGFVRCVLHRGLPLALRAPQRLLGLREDAVLHVHLEKHGERHFLTLHRGEKSEGNVNSQN